MQSFSIMLTFLKKESTDPNLSHFTPQTHLSVSSCASLRVEMTLRGYGSVMKRVLLTSVCGTLTRRRRHSAPCSGAPPFLLQWLRSFLSGEPVYWLNLLPVTAGDFGETVVMMKCAPLIRHSSPFTCVMRLPFGPPASVHTR